MSDASRRPVSRFALHTAVTSTLDTGCESTETYDTDTRKAVDDALESINIAAAADAEASAADSEVSRQVGLLATAQDALSKAEQGATEAGKILEGLYRHAAAFRTMQWITQSLQEVKGGTEAAVGTARANKRQVAAAEVAERDAQALFNATAEAFKSEHEAVADMETSVLEAEQVW